VKLRPFQKLRQTKAEFHSRKSLRSKIIIWYFIPTCVILLLVAVVSLSALQKTAENSVLDQAAQTTSLASNQLSMQIRTYLEPLIAITYVSELTSGTTPEKANILAQAKYFFGELNSTQEELGFVLLDAYGKVVIANPSTLGKPDDDWSTRAYVIDTMQLALENGPPHPSIFNIYQEKSLFYPSIVVSAMPIRGDAGDIEGVLTLMVPIHIINTLNVIEIETLNSLAAIVVDGNGRVIYHTNPEYIGLDFSRSEVVRQGENVESGALRTRNIEGDFIVAGYASVPDTPWTLIIEINWKELYGRTVGYRISLWVVLTLAALFPILFISSGVKKIVKPITELMRAAEGVASGNFEQITTIHTGDELEELANQFNAMATKVHTAYTLLEQKVAARTHELATLNAIAAVVNHSLKLDEILNATLDEILTRLNAEVGCVYLLDPVNHTLNLHAHRGMGTTWLAAVQQLASGEGSAGQAIIEQKPVVLNIADYTTERLRPLIQEKGVQALAATPILLKGEVLGSLAIGTQTARTFPPEKQSLLFAIGQQIGVGVENARLYNQAQQELGERKRARHNRVIAATTSQLEPQAVLTAVCRELGQTFDLPQAAVAMLNETRSALSVVAEYQQHARNDGALGIILLVEGNPATQYVLEHQTPLAIADTQHDPRLAPAHDIMIQRGVQSLLLKKSTWQPVPPPKPWSKLARKKNCVKAASAYNLPSRARGWASGTSTCALENK